MGTFLFFRITLFIFIIYLHLWDKFFNVFQVKQISNIFLLGKNECVHFSAPVHN